MKSAGKARSNGLYRHIRTSKEIIRNLLNDYSKNKSSACTRTAVCVCTWIVYDRGISNDRSKNNVL